MYFTVFEFSVNAPEVFGELFPAQRFAVDAYPLANRVQMRRGEESRSVTVLPQDGFAIGACGAFTFRTGHVYDG